MKTSGGGRRIFSAIVLSMIFGGVIFVAGARLLPASEPATRAAPTPFSGDVEIHSQFLGRGEEIVQIIDNTRSVVCYGKVSQGGASSLSCQKAK